MGYIQIFGEKLDALLAARGVAEADREEIIAYVKHIVLESYQNGRAACGGGKKPPTGNRPRQEK
jgi:hypothetical protein